MAVWALGGLLLALAMVQVRTGVLADSRTRLLSQLEASRRDVAGLLETWRSEVRFLVQVPPVQGIVRAEGSRGFDRSDASSEERWKRRLQGIFMAYAKTHPHVTRIRLITAGDGVRELVRVDRWGERVAMLPDSALHPIGRRSFLARAFAQRPGEVAVSGIIPNIDPDAFGSPRIPTLRIATPVYDTAGRLFGTVILNLDARGFLAQVQASVSLPFRVHLLDESGKFLLHPDTSLTRGIWGGTSAGWDDIFASRSPLGSVTEVELRPPGQGKVLVARQSLPLSDVSSREAWTIAVSLPQEEIRDKVFAARRAILLSLLGAVGLGGVLVLRLRSDARHRLAASLDRARLGAIVEASADAIVGETLDGRVASWNRSAAELFGIHELDAVGRSLEQLLFRDAGDPLEALRTRVRAGEGRVRSRIRLLGSGIRHFDVSVAMVRGEDGVPAGLAITLQEVTFQEEATVALRSMNETLERQVLERTRQIETMLAYQEAILAGAGSGIVVTELDGTVTVFNPAAQDMLGYAGGEVIGTLTVLDLIVARERPGSFEELVRDVGGSRGAWETGFLRKDGSEVRVLCMPSSLCDDEGVGIGHLFVWADLTERHRVEEELRALTREAQEAGRAKSEFLANMSHEIRTPMNAMMGMAQLLGRRPLPEDISEMVRKIIRSGSLLQVLLDDILDVSKAEAGRIELERVPFRLGDVLDDLSTVMGTGAVAKGLELVIEPPPVLPLLPVGDPHRLGQVLSNLVGNAIKFTERGRVQVAIEVQETREDELRVGFSVSDTGIGIPQELHETVFSSFTQADSSTTRRFGGTGLGLHISRLLVEAMGGRIQLESVPGEGSVFRFAVPFGIAPSQVHKPVQLPLHGESRRLEGVRVLVVDDNATNRDVVESILEDEGASACSEADGARALERLRGAPDAFDVVLMDVQMPGMDGYEATRAIRADPRLEHLPIVALSAGVLPSERAAAQGAGMDDFVPKPFRLDALVGALCRAAARKKPPEAGVP